MDRQCRRVWGCRDQCRRVRSLPSKSSSLAEIKKKKKGDDCRDSQFILQPHISPIMLCPGSLVLCTAAKWDVFRLDSTAAIIASRNSMNRQPTKDGMSEHASKRMVLS